MSTYDVGSMATIIADAVINWGDEEPEGAGALDASTVQERPDEAWFTVTIGDQRFQVTVHEMP